MKKKLISIALVPVIAFSMFSMTAFAAVTLSLNKENYTASENIAITYSGVTAEQETAGAWVGIAKQGGGAGHVLVGKMEPVNQGSGTVNITAPHESGTYEARFYQNRTAYDTSLVTSVTVRFTVGSTATQPTPTPTPPSSSEFSIVGMWRRNSTDGTRTAYQIFNSDGSTFAIVLYRHSQIIGGFTSYFPSIYVARGDYRLNGNTLEVYNASWFSMESSRVPRDKISQYAEDYTEVFRIVNAGSRSEVEKLFDPSHVLYDAYTSRHYWQDLSGSNYELIIIDANSFETRWPVDKWTLARVQE